MDQKFSIIILIVSLITAGLAVEISKSNNKKRSTESDKKPIDLIFAVNYSNTSINSNQFIYPDQFLNEECSDSRQCRTRFSECSNGKCKCKFGYVEQKGKCYGLLHSMCELPKDCALIWINCKSRSCQFDFYKKNTNEYASKPGATGIWHYSYWSQNPKFYMSPTFTGTLATTGNLEWQKDFTYDKVVAYRVTDRDNIYCRTLINGKYYQGFVTITGDGLCKYSDDKGNKISTRDYQVLVDKGQSYEQIEENIKILKKLNEPCDESSVCKPYDSHCSNSKCQCKPGFVEFFGSCYGLPGAECSGESKCISTSYNCRAGVCKMIPEESVGKNKCYNNPTGSVCWAPFEGKNISGDGIIGGMDHHGPQYVCRGTYQGVTAPGEMYVNDNLSCDIPVNGNSRSLKKFEVLINNNHMNWKDIRDTDIDTAILGSVIDGKPCLICRGTPGREMRTLFIGALKPPLYNECHLFYSKSTNKLYSTFNYQILDYSRSFYSSKH